MFLKTNNKKSNFRSVYPERKRRAFTLVEMLVVVVIVGSIMAMSVSVFQSSRKTKNVESVASSVRDVLMNARNYSITPADTTPTSATSLKISIDNTKITRQYYADTTPLDPLEKIYTFPTNFTVNSDSAKEISFNINNANEVGMVNTIGLSSFTIEASDVKYEIKIDNLSGQVSYEKVQS